MLPLQAAPVSTLKAFARERGINRILDGTNEDDLHVYRPGIRALRELGITSPLADLHITKAQVKELAAWYGISVASRPSTPCMATRIPYNTPIDYDILRRIGEGEAYLRTLVGGNVRLRLHGDIARIEVDFAAIEQLLGVKEQAAARLKELGFAISLWIWRDSGRGVWILGLKWKSGNRLMVPAGSKRRWECGVDMVEVVATIFDSISLNMVKACEYSF